jgi:hypothetical protein
MKSEAINADGDDDALRLLIRNIELFVITPLHF